MKHVFIICFLFILIIPIKLNGHCDTFSGPVIQDAKLALEKGSVTPVLKWIKKEYEKEITDLFNKTLLVRTKGNEAKELADMYFFETLVRLHRAGEGEPYTGLKTAEVEPIVALSDQSLATGQIDELITELNKEAGKNIKELFTVVLEKKKHANDSVEAGREYVTAYVTFMHFVENIHTSLAGTELPHHD